MGRDESHPFPHRGFFTPRMASALHLVAPTNANLCNKTAGKNVKRHCKCPLGKKERLVTADPLQFPADPWGPGTAHSPGPRDCLALLPPRPWAHYSVWVPSWWSQLVGKRQRTVAVGALGPLCTLGTSYILGSKSKAPTEAPGADEGLPKSAS